MFNHLCWIKHVEIVFKICKIINLFNDNVYVYTFCISESLDKH